MNHTAMFAASFPILFTLAACSAGAAPTASTSDEGNASSGLVSPADSVGSPCVQAARWRVDGDVAIDTANGGRTWQRDVDATPRTQPEAVAYCAALALGDGGGWRLPTAAELHSIVLNPIGLGGSHGPTCVPSIDAAAFPDAPIDSFWSATTRDDGGETVAMFTEFDDGRSHPSPLDTPMRVRCVHDPEVEVK